MSLSINWTTQVISVPQAYLSFLSGSDYELDVDQFRKDLNDIQDSEEGMPFLDTHRHNSQVTLGTITLARVVEIINGYTVTFEDGQYIVNLTSANNNLLDVTNLNQVSIRSANSAGLITVVSGSGVIAQDVLDIADAVWDEANADHTIDGTFGGELATKADIQASTATDFSVAISGTVVQGSVGSGTYVSTNVRDGTYWQIDEDGTNGITVEFTFNLPSADHRAGVVDVYGRYEGTPSINHYQELWAYNYESTTWEQLVETFMPGGITSDEEFTHEYYERHIDRTSNNEVQIRTVHNVTTYNAGHDLYFDYVAVSSIDVVTAADIADAVLDEPLAGHQTADTTGRALRAAQQLAIGRWRFDDTAKTLTFYQPDGLTVLVVFDMKDDVGNPTLEGVYERVPQ